MSHTSIYKYYKTCYIMYIVNTYKKKRKRVKLNSLRLFLKTTNHYFSLTRSQIYIVAALWVN